MKVIEMFSDYEGRDEAKKLGCRWDGSMMCWYVSLDRHEENPDVFAPYKRLALADTNDITNETMKELNCKWNSVYKKWLISEKIYNDNKTQFDLYKLIVLTKITKVYNYVPPPVKSDEDQLAELMLLMSTDNNED